MTWAERAPDAKQMRPTATAEREEGEQGGPRSHLLETKWNVFVVVVCAALQRAGPGAWSPRHAAPDLPTHFLTQEIELTPRPGPRGPTAAYAAVH
ncbi:hypothetical protein EYF80_004952 [Liparis tanakae]|uniref:Uncharacterized protein n=1 Tax=Liparis tanakae TaxID=230148 RepID=A0A4Z2J4G2_9TELE|nr:hypothetical protein EYF80_004952 [Liparis tanakae]